MPCPRTLPPLVAIVLALACGPRSGATAVEPARDTRVAPPAAAEPALATGVEPTRTTGPAADTAPALPDFSDPTWKHVTSRAGTYTVHWRSTPAPVPRNEPFELAVWVLRDGALVGAEAYLSVHAWMPDHGHGMLRRTQSTRLPDGSYHVEGMLLHMRGTWQIFFDLLEGTLAETAEHVLEL